MRPPRFPISKEIAAILGALLLLLFASPVADWWSRGGLNWTTPYALWLLVILAAYFIHRRGDSDEP
jgi:hypothetical protein